MGDSNAVQGACYCVCILISVIVFVIQSANESNEKSEVSPDYNSSYVPIPLDECTRNFTTQAGNWEIIACGGTCEEKCGVCDPTYDGCFGTKYCPVRCDDGVTCDSANGPYQASFCKSGFCFDDLCSPVPSPVKCSDNERHFHWTLTAAYSTYLVCGIIVLCLFRRRDKNSDGTSHYISLLYLIPAAACFICSISFAGVCEGGESTAAPRLITMIVFASLSLIFLPICSLCLQASDATNKESLKLVPDVCAAYVLTFTADIMLSQIHKVHSVLEAVNVELYPFVAANKQCEAYESKFYAAWNIINGGVFILSGPVCLVLFDRQPRRWLFSLPLWITWLVNVSFLGACKTEGHTLIVPYGITMCVVYFIIAVTIGIFRFNKCFPPPEERQYEIRLGKLGKVTWSVDGPNTTLLAHAIGFGLICWSLYITNKVTKQE